MNLLPRMELVSYRRMNPQEDLLTVRKVWLKWESEHQYIGGHTFWRTYPECKEVPLSTSIKLFKLWRERYLPKRPARSRIH